MLATVGLTALTLARPMQTRVRPRDPRRRRRRCRPIEPIERGHMTKAELIDAVAKSAEVSKVDAERTLAAFFEHVTKSTKKGDKVAWPGFGSFSTAKRAARTGRNPQNGEKVKIAASTAMRFTPSATL